MEPWEAEALRKLEKELISMRRQMRMEGYLTWAEYLRHG